MKDLIIFIEAMLLGFVLIGIPIIAVCSDLCNWNPLIKIISLLLMLAEHGFIVMCFVELKSR